MSRIYQVFNRWIQSMWYGPKSLCSYCLMPFSLVYWLVMSIRQQLYKCGIFKTYHSQLPIIVVGNITLGGTGKTPFVIGLAEHLIGLGYKPAVILRGYGGRLQGPCRVTNKHTAKDVGDEAILLHNRITCPIVIAQKRVDAVNVCEALGCQVVISDDGLQHCAMGRAIEIAVVDAKRLFGNKLLFPAGPLRQPVKRLQYVDFIIVNGAVPNNCKPLISSAELSMTVEAQSLMQISSDRAYPANAMINQPVTAVSAIGNPQRFLDMLVKLGYTIKVSHDFPDHYSFCESEIVLDENTVVIMTEKDAVKCRSELENLWYVKIAARCDYEKIAAFLAKKIAI